MDHIEGIDPKTSGKPLKQWISRKVACNPYAKRPLLMASTNMNPSSLRPPKGIKPKEAWRTALLPLRHR